jgi:hypothetical protein
VEGERAGMLLRDIDLEQVAVAEKRVAKSDSGIETGRSNKRRHIFLAVLVFCLLAGAFIPVCYHWYLDHTGAVEEAVAPVALQKSRLASTATYSGITQAGVSNLSTAQQATISVTIQQNHPYLVRCRVGGRRGRGPGGFPIKVQGGDRRGVVVRQVRKTRHEVTGPEVWPTSAFYTCISTGIFGPITCIFCNLTQWHLTPFSP